MSVTPPDMTIESGTRVDVTCVTKSTGASITYNFLRDNKIITSQPGGTYTMGSISTSQSGTYTCTATMNSVTSALSPGHTVRIIGESFGRYVSIVKALNRSLCYFFLIYTNIYRLSMYCSYS